MEYNRDFEPSRIRQLHFIGIGGIGMSGIAALMIGMGYKVSGSDINRSEIISALLERGARINIGHMARLPEGTEAVVVSSAIKEDNPEIIAARQAHIPIIHRAFMLAALAGLKKTVTIAGTHGKTTVTSMMASAFASAGAGASAVIGGILKNAGSNLLMGGGEYFIAEADESDGSFLDFKPLVTCITNIDNDHLEHYGTLSALYSAFIQHINSIPFFGAAALCIDDKGIRAILPHLRAPIIKCGLSEEADWRAMNISISETGTSYEAWFKGEKKGNICLALSGLHNVRNSLLALSAGVYLGLPFEQLSAGLALFKGVKRRLDCLGSAGGVEFIDDYGHHPTEISATLSAVKSLFPARRLIVIFQPHRYSRTKALFKDFAHSLSGADKIFIAPIYPAGEPSLPGISSKLIINAASSLGLKAQAFPGVLDMLKELSRGDVLLTLGAGDIWKIGMELKLKRDMLGADLALR